MNKIASFIKQIYANLIKSAQDDLRDVIEEVFGEEILEEKEIEESKDDTKVTDEPQGKELANKNIENIIFDINQFEHEFQQNINAIIKDIEEGKTVKLDKFKNTVTNLSYNYFSIFPLLFFVYSLYSTLLKYVEPRRIKRYKRVFIPLHNFLNYIAENLRIVSSIIFSDPNEIKQYIGKMNVKNLDKKIDEVLKVADTINLFGKIHGYTSKVFDLIYDKIISKFKQFLINAFEKAFNSNTLAELLGNVYLGDDYNYGSYQMILFNDKLYKLTADVVFDLPNDKINDEVRNLLFDDFVSYIRPIIDNHGISISTAKEIQNFFKNNKDVVKDILMDILKDTGITISDNFDTIHDVLVSSLTPPNELDVVNTYINEKCEELQRYSIENILLSSLKELTKTDREELLNESKKLVEQHTEIGMMGTGVESYTEIASKFQKYIVFLIDETLNKLRNFIPIYYEQIANPISDIFKELGIDIDLSINENKFIKLFKEKINDILITLNNIYAPTTKLAYLFYLYNNLTDLWSDIKTKLEGKELIERLTAIKEKFMRKKSFVSKGDIIEIDNDKYIIISAEDKILLADYDLLNSEHYSELYTCEDLPEFKVVGTLDFSVKKCPVNDVIVKMSTVCSNCAYNVKINNEYRCMPQLDNDTSNTRHPKVVIDKSSNIDKIIEKISFKTLKQSIPLKDKSVSIYDIVMHKTGRLGVVTEVNYDNSLKVLWDNDKETIVWRQEVQTVDEDYLSKK